ncbi:MAG TPA: hypothetical protein VEI26_05210 [Terriglobales bacterium]|nr:hypothetical protein [Terriglobales bacterium]
MDSMVLIMFGSVIATITGLNFMELRKIRKNLERKSMGQDVRKAANTMVGESVRT